MEFSRQEYWHGLPYPSPGDLPDPGIEPRSPALQADSLLFEYVSVIFIVITIRDRQGDDFCCYLVAKLCLTLL